MIFLPLQLLIFCLAVTCAISVYTYHHNVSVLMYNNEMLVL